MGPGRGRVILRLRGGAGSDFLQTLLTPVVG